ncbi:MAG: Lrp/AsnC family transcriptional regulator [Dorea sp.]|jgi:DNA-binding Lrp family transcriptional regulator|nr:Lrp/AsnC family transcriptional regulator [Oscillospiraceae bacterium]MCI9339694.1 Lrp/AsnC family transcriptional regulator [Dorea sp.]
MDQILQILSGNARMDAEQIAVMLDMPAEEVKKKISEYERKGIIRGYKPLLDYDKIGTELVEAVIEVKVSPQRDFGFEEIAHTISEFSEVSSVYLMSGGYDLHIRVVGRTFKDIALFVAQRLAVLDGVLSTATHFVLSRYKDWGVVLGEEGIDERRIISI